MHKTGNETTDKLIGIEFSGNVIHNQWYKTIVKENGKADIIAINILADIVYWYRPTEVRNESTGQTIGYKKKYKADLLQRGYESYADQFGISKRQVKSAMDRLEELDIIRKDFRNITTVDKLFLSNVLYIKLNFKTLHNLSFTDVTKICNTSHEKTLDVVQNTQKEVPSYKKEGDILQKNVGGGTLNSNTYTKTTTQTTTKINKDKASSLPTDGIYKPVDNFTRDALTVYVHFMRSYTNCKGEVHPVISNKVVDKLNSIMEEGTIYDPDMDKDLFIDVEAMCAMIDKYFITDYPLTTGGKADHRIYHFLSEMVMKNLYYKECY